MNNLVGLLFLLVTRDVCRNPYRRRYVTQRNAAQLDNAVEPQPISFNTRREPIQAQYSDIPLRTGTAVHVLCCTRLFFHRNVFSLLVTSRARFQRIELM